MADIHIQEVEYKSELRCPVCDGWVPVIAMVQVQSGEARHAGTTGMVKVVSVNLKTKILGFKINHECRYTNPEED